MGHHSASHINDTRELGVMTGAESAGGTERWDPGHRRDVGLGLGGTDEKQSIWAADRMGCGKMKCLVASTLSEE